MDRCCSKWELDIRKINNSCNTIQVFAESSNITWMLWWCESCIRCFFSPSSVDVHHKLNPTLSVPETPTTCKIPHQLLLQTVTNEFVGVHKQAGSTTARNEDVHHLFVKITENWSLIKTHPKSLLCKTSIIFRNNFYENNLLCLNWFKRDVCSG